MHLWKLLLCCVVLFFSASADASPNFPIKVLSFNFNSENVPNDHKDILRDIRLASLVQWVHDNDPDIITLQEAWNYRDDSSIGVTLSKTLGYDVAYRVGMGFPGILLDSNVILAKRSLKMRDQTDLKLPHSAFEIGDGKTWVFELGPVTWGISVTLELPDGKPLYLYTSHLIGSTTQDRADQIVAIDNDLKQRAAKDGIAWSDARVIVAGDLNSDPTDPGPSFLRSQGYIDSFDAIHPRSTACTFCSDPAKPYFNPITIGAGLVPPQNEATPDQRIDYVWSRGPCLNPLSSTIVFSTPYNGIWMSDHFGIFATFGEGSPQPSPVYDHEDTLPLSQLVRVTDTLFRCAANSAGCSQLPLRINADPFRGITMINDSSADFSVEIEGPKPIFTRADVELAPSQMSSFTFMHSGDYRFWITNENYQSHLYQSTIEGNIHVEDASGVNPWLRR